MTRCNFKVGGKLRCKANALTGMKTCLFHTPDNMRKRRATKARYSKVFNRKK